MKNALLFAYCNKYHLCLSYLLNKITCNLSLTIFCVFSLSCLKLIVIRCSVIILMPREMICDLVRQAASYSNALHNWCLNRD